MSGRRLALIALGAVATGLAAVAGLVAVGVFVAGRDPFVPLYAEHCSVCHGDQLEGTAQGPPLVGAPLTHGDSVDEISRSIAEGFAQRGMPAWSGILDDAQIRSLTIYIAERRAGHRFTDFKVDQPLQVPGGRLSSEEHDFRIETVARDLDPLPFSIAPLPDGRILLTEKKRGLSIVGTDGVQSEPIARTPETYERALTVNELQFGIGWLLDVALHPDYGQNGWVYLQHGHICRDCGDDEGGGLIPITMNRLIRGRIRDGRWVDEEVIWRAAPEHYTRTPDLAAGGRTAFDPDGYVFISVGIKGHTNFDGVQDLGKPYGKIHRVHDDGRIPADNPFVDEPGAIPSIWTYGHRSPQGLEFHPGRRQLWSTEMGPRGGDELNMLQPGRNYGWPLTSKGLDYDGTPVEYGKELGIEFALEDIEQPVVDFTPAPAISSFAFYAGNLFPRWQGDLIVGSLKATELYRIVLDGDRAVHRERLIGDLARIRDVEIGPDGAVYLLLEHASGGRIVRLVPDEG